MKTVLYVPQMESLEVEKRALESSLQDALTEKQRVLERFMQMEKKTNSLATRFNTLNQDLKDRTAALQELGEENQELQRTITDISSRSWQAGLSACAPVCVCVSCVGVEGGCVCLGWVGG